MIRMTFSPPNGDVRVFEFPSLDEHLTALEAEDIELSGGPQWDTFVGWGLQLTQGSVRACRVLLWVLLRRDNPALALADLDFPVSAMALEQVDDDEPEGKDEPGDAGTSSP